MNVVHYEVSVDGVTVHLAGKQFEVLKYLFHHIGKVVPHSILLQAVWGPEYASSVDELRVYISNLRKVIEADPGRPRYLLTVHGVGYKLALLP